MHTDINLPEELGPFKGQVYETLRPFIQLLPQEKQDIMPWESKIGGLPYLPLTMEYPAAPDGRPFSES